MSEIQSQNFIGARIAGDDLRKFNRTGFIMRRPNYKILDRIQLALSVPIQVAGSAF